MDKNNLFDIAKKPIIGELIIFFAIFLTLGAISGTLNHFDLKGAEKGLLFRAYFIVSLMYVVGSLSFRAFRVFNKEKKG